MQGEYLLTVNCYVMELHALDIVNFSFKCCEFNYCNCMYTRLQQNIIFGFTCSLIDMMYFTVTHTSMVFVINKNWYSIIIFTYSNFKIVYILYDFIINIIISLHTYNLINHSVK